MQNVQSTILTQYQNAPTLNQLIKSLNGYLDPSPNFATFRQYVWDIASAVGYGLDRLGRVLGVGRVLQVATGDSFLGFEEAGDPNELPYGQAPFFSGQAVTGNYALTDDAFRTLLYAKALANICDGSVTSINNVLMTLFPGRGDCYVVDNYNNSFVYHFTFTPTAVELAIISQSGVLPRPSGKSATVFHP